MVEQIPASWRFGVFAGIRDRQLTGNSTHGLSKAVRELHVSAFAVIAILQKPDHRGDLLLRLRPVQVLVV